MLQLRRAFPRGANVLHLVPIALLFCGCAAMSSPGPTPGPAAADTQESSVSAAASDSLPDWRALWDFSDPAGSETRFREAWQSRGATAPPCYRLELQTQIARAQGLQGRFAEAHALLDSVAAELATAGDPAATCGARIRVRYLLERGRLRNTAGHAQEAQPHFREAWQVARTAGEDCLAIDAAHMLAIVTLAEEQLQWNLRALEAAEDSRAACALRWRGPLFHNLGMAHLEAERFVAALDLFERDWAFRQEHGDSLSRRIAKWCVAHTLRRMDHLADALAMQRELERETAAAGIQDGYVFEEIAECLLALGREDEAPDYLARAYRLLSEDRWLVEHEPQRLARLQGLAESLAREAMPETGEAH